MSGVNFSADICIFPMSGVLMLPSSCCSAIKEHSKDFSEQHNQHIL
jgi:hypothetical protein